MSNKNKRSPKTGATIKDRAITIGIIAVIVIVLIFLIVFLYIPSLSYKIFGVATYSGFNGVADPLTHSSIGLTKNVPFADLAQGDIIVFRISDSDNPGFNGLKAFQINSFTPEGVVVATGDSPIGFLVDETMYLGKVTSHVKGLGAITGFLGSVFGLLFIIILIAVIVAIVIVVKRPEEQVVVEEADSYSMNEEKVEKTEDEQETK